MPRKLKKLNEGLINIKNNGNKCFWCQIKHSNSLKKHPEGIKKADKKMFDDRDYEGFGFSMSKKDFSKIKRKMIFALMCFVTKIS